MKYTLPALPYPEHVLEPVISRETIQIHYGKHAQTYLNNLNDMIAGTEYEDMSLEDTIRSSAGSLFNNAAQTWNHIFYFNTFSPDARVAPQGSLAHAIVRHWETFENFQEVFVQMGKSLFGSGWVWLATDRDGRLYVIAKPNAGTPLTDGLTPLLSIDLWEHAYYIDYRNMRKDAINNLWKVIDWNKIEERYNNAIGRNK